MSHKSLLDHAKEVLTGTPPDQKAAAGPATPSLVKDHPADAGMGTPGKNDEERLDEALQETMPTSDPVSIRIE